MESVGSLLESSWSSTLTTGGCCFIVERSFPDATAGLSLKVSLMIIGDRIYDSHYCQCGLVIEISENSSYVTVLYEDGEIDRGMRMNDPEIEVISESR